MEKKRIMTWPKLIIFAMLAGVYAAIMAIIPAAKDTSFADITISFEVWILFGILIIMKSKSNLDSALKCFVFFVISQPLIYLLQVPFSSMGWNLFGYYKYWFIWTVLTIPMGFIGYYMKKDKWWGYLILAPILVFLMWHLSMFIKQTLYFFPNHLLSALFCAVTLIAYPVAIFKNKKIKIVGTFISIIMVVVAIAIALSNRLEYNTTLLLNGENHIFDDSYLVYIEDKSMGDVHIDFDENIQEYMLNANFKKAGQTKLTIESPKGEKVEYDLDVKYYTYTIEKVEEQENVEINEGMTQEEIEKAIGYIEGESFLKDDMPIVIEDSGDGSHYTFKYKKYTFDAVYTEDNWKIVESYKIRNRKDITLICQELSKIHPIHTKDMKSYRTAEDMANEWITHNIAYKLLPTDSSWRLNARDVDLDPKDEGKNLFEIYKDRVENK